MTVSYNVGTTSTGASASFNMTIANTTSAGDVIVVSAWTASGPATGVTDTQGNQYVLANANGNTTQWVSVGETVPLVAGTDHITTKQASSAAGNAQATGVPGAVWAPVDAVVSKTGSGTSISLATGALITEDGQIAVAAIANTASNPTWGAGFTSITNSHGSSTEFLGVGVLEGITSGVTMTATITSSAYTALIVTLQMTSFVPPAGNVPSPPVQRAGETASSSDMNALAQTALWMRRPPMAVAQTNVSGTGQGLTVTAAAVSWSTVTRDTDGFWAPGQPTRLVVTNPGFYKVLFSIPFAVASVNCQAYIRITTGTNNPVGSGVQKSYWQSFSQAANGNDGCCCGGGVVPLYLYANDYIQIMTAVNTAANMPISPQPGQVSMRLVSV